MYVGDVQDSIHGKANDFFREALRRHPDTEFFVFGGDLTERPTEQRWEETYRGLDSIGQRYPVITVTGNHEYLKYIIRKLERRFSLVFSYYLDSMVGKNQVYTLKYNDMQIFCLDSNREFFYLWTQKKWLEEQLKKSNARWKIVVLHHPLYSIKGSMNNLFQRTMFNPLVEKYGVDLVLQGHEHAYARMTAHGENGEAQAPIYTVSHCSPKNYYIEFDKRFDKFGTGSRYYQQIRVHGDTLTMNAYDVTTNDLYDAVDIIKDQTGKSRLEDRGKEIPEALIFHSNGGKKEEAFQKRIDEYKQRKGIR
jgi:predicted phosphodiesterase